MPATQTPRSPIDVFIEELNDYIDARATYIVDRRENPEYCWNMADERALAAALRKLIGG